MISASTAQAGLYLVEASGGPGFSSPQQALEILQNGVIPTFDALMKLEADKKIIAGGLPAGDRTFVFIMDASSIDEFDRTLRDIHAWGVFNWKVTPLQSINGRAKKEVSLSN